MIDQLIRLANHLDRKALYREANYLDYIIKTASDEDKAFNCFNEKIDPRHIDRPKLSKEKGSKNYTYFASSKEAIEASPKTLYALVKGDNPPNGNYLKIFSEKCNGVTLFKLSE